MSDHKNQPHMVPSGPVGHSILSRSNIMGTGTGKYPWTMFMPGQSSGRDNEYPTDWPAANRLIRVPKCVFLTSNPPVHLWGKNFTLMSKWAPYGYFGHYFDWVIRDTRYTPAQVSGYGNEIFGGYAGLYSYIGWTIDPQYSPDNDGPRKWHKCCVVKNPIYDEHYRLVKEFKKAKEILEGRYPNDVFVEICQFFPNDPLMTIAPNDELMPKVYDAYTDAGIEANQPQSGANGPAWLLGPDKAVFDFDAHKSTTPFFGSNFLHIYCGYQDDGGDSQPRSREDTLGRWTFYNQHMGYKLDRNFGPGFDEWIEITALPSGYEGIAYNIALAHMNGALGNTPPDEALTDPANKLDYLRVGFPNFANYKVCLHEYDLTFTFPDAKFLLGGNGHSPLYGGPTQYQDQDWVEETVIIGYSTRVQIYADSHDPYGDQAFPGPGGPHGDGYYNTFVKYPGTDEYVNTWVPQLNEQHDLLQKACAGLGPKTKSIWLSLIDTHSLNDMGIEYTGGSSMIDADYIVQYAEDYYGLTPP